MTVGVLIVTHNKIGNALLDAAKDMLGICPLATEVLTVPQDCEPEQIAREAIARIQALDSSDGVLVLADIFGATPCNIALRLQNLERVSIVTGVNLPMLIRVLNYPQLDLRQLVNKAVSGGKDGIMPVNQVELDDD